MWQGNDRELILSAAEGAIVIWDFDGVIADTEPLHEESYRRILKRLGYTPAPDFYPPFTGKSDSYIWGELVKMGVELDEDAAHFEQEKSDTLRVVVSENITLNPSWFVTDLLDDLALVAARQVILSNGDIEIIKELLLRWGLSEQLEVIQKPNENKKKELLLGFLTQSRCLVFEDNKSTLDLVRQYSAFSVGVRHPMFSTEELTADVVIPIKPDQI